MVLVRKNCVVCSEKNCGQNEYKIVDMHAWFIQWMCYLKINKKIVKWNSCGHINKENFLTHRFWTLDLNCQSLSLVGKLVPKSNLQRTLKQRICHTNKQSQLPKDNIWRTRTNSRFWQHFSNVNLRQLRD